MSHNEENLFQMTHQQTNLTVLNLNKLPLSSTWLTAAHTNPSWFLPAACSEAVLVTCCDLWTLTPTSHALYTQILLNKEAAAFSTYLWNFITNLSSATYPHLFGCLCWTNWAKLHYHCDQGQPTPPHNTFHVYCWKHQQHEPLLQNRRKASSVWHRI